MSNRGVSIPTALFFVLIAFLISTVMAARAHMDLQLTRYDGLEMEREAAAKGTAARVLVELNKDDKWKAHDADHRFQFESTAAGDRFDTEGWVAHDPDNPLIYHIFGRAYSGSAEGQSSLSSRVVLRRPDVEGMIFTNSPIGDGRYQPDSLFYRRGYDTDWTLIPPAPVITFDEYRNPHKLPGRFCGSLNNIAVDSKGRVYAHYIPGYDRDDFIGDIFRQKYRNYLKDGNYSGMYRAIPDYVETLGYGLRAKAFGGSSIMRYDTSKGEWEALPAVPAVNYSGGKATLDPSHIYDGGVGPIEVAGNSVYAALFRDGRDAMLRLDQSTNKWEVIQPPPTNVYVEATQCQADEKGNLYAKWGNIERSRTALYRMSGNKPWEEIPLPARGQFDENGKWHLLGGTVPDIQHMDVTADGKVYGVWNAQDYNSQWSYVVYEFSADEHGVEKWKAIPPSPGLYYDAKESRYAEDSNKKRFKFAKSIAVDAEERVITSLRDGGNSSAHEDPLVYQQGEDYIPLGLLPEKGFDSSGNFVDDVRRIDSRGTGPFQAAGGGYVNGSKERYIPVYRY